MTERLIELRDPGQMRALAHPLRLRVIAALQEDGPATASVLAVRLGESPALLSYHLRQLARHSFVEEAPELGRNRKERPWRALGVGERFAPGILETPEGRPAASAVLAELVDAAARRFYAYLDALESLPPEWRSALLYEGRVVVATPSEVEQLRHRLTELLEPFDRRESERPHGSRRVRFSIQGVPDLGADGGSESPPE